MKIYEIEKKINYTFKDKQLLVRAFTHSSYAYEKKITSNEMLEFLGDSVLSLIISSHLYKHAKSNWREKDLSEKRASVVSKEPLARAVDKLDIIQYLLCGVGESRSNPVKSDAIKGDLFEAVTGAIFLDSNSLEITQNFILTNLKDALSHALKTKTDNYVGKLLEYTLKPKKEVFFCKDNSQNNKPNFYVEVVINGKVLANASGKSKTEAERQAAKAVCEKLGLL